MSVADPNCNAPLVLDLDSGQPAGAPAALPSVGSTRGFDLRLKRLSRSTSSLSPTTSKRREATSRCVPTFVNAPTKRGKPAIRSSRFPLDDAQFSIADQLLGDRRSARPQRSGRRWSHRSSRRITRFKALRALLRLDPELVQLGSRTSPLARRHARIARSDVLRSPRVLLEQAPLSSQWRAAGP